MINNQFVEDATKIYLISYNTAMEQVRNTSLATQAAFMVTKMICDKIENKQELKANADIMGMIVAQAMRNKAYTGSKKGKETTKKDEQSADTEAG